MSVVHPSASVSPEAVLGQHLQIGPFCVIEAGVVLGDGCRLESHAVVRSGVLIGSDNYLGEGVVIGGLPQHRHLIPRPGRVVIGRGNTFREHVTVHRAMKEEGETRIGNRNLLMVNVHVAHDCVVGDETIMANNVMLAGHVLVEDRAYLSGAVGVHQFCRIGRYAMVGGQAHITKDVPPFVTVDGASSMIVGLNVVGLRRAGFSREDLEALKAAYRIAFRRGLRWEDTLAQLRILFPSGEVAALHQFLEQTRRGCIQERRVPKSAALRLHLDDNPETRAADDASPSHRRTA